MVLMAFGVVTVDGVGGDVEVVAGPPAGHRDVERLAPHPWDGQDVGVVDGDPLCTVDGGRVGELDLVVHVAGRHCHLGCAALATVTGCEVAGSGRAGLQAAQREGSVCLGGRDGPERTVADVAGVGHR